MAKNSYIKDFIRYPPGVSKTADGFTFNPSYIDNSNDCITINNEEFKSSDGTGLNQFRVFRTQFDSAPFTDPSSTTTAVALIGNWFVVYAVNHTARIDPPYSFLSLRGAMTMSVEFKFKQESCPEIVRAGGSRFKKMLCKAIGAYRRTGVQCAAGLSVSGITRKMFEKFFGIRCTRIEFKKDGEISFKVRGGYGSTGQFICLLSDRRTPTRPFINVSEDTWHTYSNLSGSFSTNRSHPSAGLYTLQVRDFWTDDQMDMYINLTFSDSGLTRKTTVKYGSRVLLYEHNNTVTSPPTVCWIAPDSMSSSRDAPPSGLLDFLSVNNECSLNTAVTASGFVFPNLYPVSAQFQISNDNTAWANLGVLTVVAPSLLTTFVSAINTFTTETYSVFYRLRLSNTRGTTTIDKDILTLTTAEIDTNWESEIEMEDDFNITYDITTNQFSFTNRFTSCYTYRLSVFAWNIDVIPSIETTLQAITSISASNVPVGTAMVSSFTFADGTSVNNTMSFTTPQVCTGATGRYLFAVLGEYGPAITIAGGQTAPLISKNLYPAAIYAEPDTTVSPVEPEEKIYTIMSVPCKWRVSIAATGSSGVSVAINRNTTSGAITLTPTGTIINLTITCTSMDVAGGTVGTSTQTIAAATATTLSVIVPTTATPTLVTGSNNNITLLTIDAAGNITYTHDLSFLVSDSSIAFDYQ